MELTMGLKHTEIGLIPENWGLRKLRDEIEKLDAGVSVNSVDEEFQIYSHHLFILKTSAVFNGKFNPLECKKVAPKDVSRAKLNPRANTIIISRMNTPDLVGECGYVERDYPNIYLPDRLWMTCFYKNTEVEVKWLSYLLGMSQYKAKLKSAATGTSGSMKNLSKDALLNIIIPLPPLSEQRAIASALSDVDALLAGLDALIAKKRLIKQGAMQELLTGKRRLPGFSGKIENKTFGELVTVRKEKIDPQKTEESLFCVELEHIGQGTGRLIGFTETDNIASLKSAFRKGDVLFGKLRAYLRKYWLSDRDGVCTTEIWPLVANPSLVINTYLFQLVQTDGFIESASEGYGTHMPRTDWNVVKNYEFITPAIPEQQTIAEILSDMDAEISALEQRREKTRLLKQGMMQELLTGRIRLI